MKSLSFAIILLIVCGDAHIVKVKSPYNPDFFLHPSLRFKDATQWGNHILDFLNLIDQEKVTALVFEYLDDPELLEFVSFIYSDDFRKLVFDFEAMAEFKEAFDYLSSKGYDVKSLLDYVNSVLDLTPPFIISNPVSSKGKGLSKLIEVLIGVLPITDMKELFNDKLTKNPEVAELYETIISQEFIDILTRLSKNPTLTEVKEAFENHGVDFQKLWCLVQDNFSFQMLSE